MGTVTNRWQQFKLDQLEAARRRAIPSEAPVLGSREALSAFVERQDQARADDVDRSKSKADWFRDESPALAVVSGALTVAFAAGFVLLAFIPGHEEPSVFPLAGVTLGAMMVGWILNGFAAALAERGRLWAVSTLAVFFALSTIFWAHYI